MPALESLGFGAPPVEVPQASVRAKAAEMLAELAPELLKKLDVFETVGIDTRRFVRPLDWYLESRGWNERSQVFAEEGLALVEAAARDALARAGLPPDAVDGIVLVTTTGIATPSLDARLVDRLGLRADIHRVPVWGLGCAGGVAGLDTAARLVQAQPEKRYLVVCLELCSLAFDISDMSVRAFVANTLFADGCAAALVRGDAVDGDSLGHVREGLAHQWPGSERVMGWDVQDDGLRVVFSRRIPELVRHGLAPLVEQYGKREDVSFDRFAFHPGGTKVLRAYEEALDLPADAMAAARDVLRERGNMSSPTVLHVLDRVLASPLAPGETALTCALGPGFSANLVALEG